MSPIYKLLLLQIVLYCLGLCALAEKMMRPKFKEIKLWTDEKYATHKITYDASDPHLNFTLDVLQDVPDVDLRLEATITNKLDPFYTATLNSTINLCRLLGWTSKSPVGSLVHGFIKEYGKIIDNCPVTKGKYRMHLNTQRRLFQGQYHIHKFWWPEDTTVATLPEFDFDVQFSVYNLDNASKQRKLILHDHIAGDFTVQDVNNVKPGIFAMLPKVG